MEKAKNGGAKNKKKAPAKGAPKEEEKQPSPENCAIFVALEYPEWKKQVLEILGEF